MHNVIRMRIRIVLHVQNTCQGVAGTHINQTPMQGVGGAVGRRRLWQLC